MYSNFRRLHREWCFSRILLENDVDNILAFIEAWVNNKQSVSMAMGYQKAKDQKLGYSVFQLSNLRIVRCKKLLVFRHQCDVLPADSGGSPDQNAPVGSTSQTSVS